MITRLVFNKVLTIEVDVKWLLEVQAWIFILASTNIKFEPAVQSQKVPFEA